jgi:subtilisin-like proprotein convertase family protein
MKRIWTFLIAVAVATTTVSLVGAAVAGDDLGAVAAEAQGKSTTVTKTFANTDQILVNDNNPANPYPSTIDINNRAFKKGKIKDVDVKLRGYEHALSDDADVMLVGPQGQNAIVFSDVGGDNSVTGLVFTLDDAATRRLPDANEPVSGTFRPTNHALQGGDAFPFPAPMPGGSSLSVFNGTNPTGTWQLFIFDDNGVGAGMFAGGWSLKIKARLG